MLVKWVWRAIFSKGPKGRTEAYKQMFFHMTRWGQDMKFTVNLKLEWTERWASKRKWVRGSRAGKIPDRWGWWWPGELGKRGWRWHRPCQRLPTCLVCIDSHPPRPASCETISGPNQSEPLEAPCPSNICSHWSLSQGLWSLGRRHGKFYFCRSSKMEGCHWSECQK